MNPIPSRTLGEGFGQNNEFYLSLNEVNRGISYDIPADQRQRLKEWIDDSTRTKAIDEIVDANTLAAVMPDLLVDQDVPTLAKLVLPKAILALFKKQIYTERLDRRFIEKLEKATDNRHLVEAYRYPALLDVMDVPDRQLAAVEIARVLKPKYFRPLVDPSYFHVQLKSSRHPVTLNSNGRSLRFFPQTGQSTALFRNFEWTLDHTHIHFELDGEEREYVIEPSLFKVAGEVHTVYSRMSKQGYKKYMAIGIPLAIGSPNKVLRRLFTQKKPYINFQELFMRGFVPENALYHSWASLQSKTAAFIDGLRFSISPEPIELSLDQYTRLKELFGKMSDLDPLKVLNPIDRKAYRRAKLFESG